MLTRSLEKLKHQDLSLERIREVAYNSRVCTHNEGACMNPGLACSCLNHDYASPGRVSGVGNRNGLTEQALAGCQIVMKVGDLHVDGHPLIVWHP